MFEGLDGAGTTTQIARLARWLGERGVDVELTQEPSTGPLGTPLRLAIDGRVALDPRAMALAFAADRIDHLANPERGVAQSLAAGRWVLSDRYVLSSLAYQATDDMDLAWLVSINRFATAPDVTIFVDTSPATCIARIEQRSGNDDLFHRPAEIERVHRNYQRVLGEKQHIGHLISVDGDASEDAVAAAIIAGFEAWWKSTLST